MPEFVADEQQPQAVLLQHFERLARHIGLGIARPDDAQLAELLRDRLGARQVVGEGIVVEEEFAHLREAFLRRFDLGDDMLDAAHAIFMAADGLGPQAEGAMRFTAAARIDRDIRVHQIADEIILDPEIAVIDVGDERKLVHVLEHGPLAVMDDLAGGIAIAQAVDRLPGLTLGDLFDGEIELVARDKVEHRRGGEALLRLDSHFGADEADLEFRVTRLHRLRDLHVVREGRRRGVHHHQFIILGERQNLLHRRAGRRRIDQPAAGHQRRGLRQPGRIPEGADFAARLVARAGAAIEALERRWL